MMGASTTHKIIMTGGTFAATWGMVQHGGEGAIIAAVLASVVLSNADRIIDKFKGGESPQPVDGDDYPTEKEIAAYRRLKQRKQPDWMPDQDAVDAEAEEIARAYEGAAEPFLLGGDDGIKTFKQLIESDVIQQMLREDSKKPFLERRVIIGYVQGKLCYVTIQDLYSCGIGGTSRTGKSTTVRFLLFQFILRGFKLVMIDPHIKDIEESLAAQFTMFPGVHALPPCGEDDEAIKKYARKMQTEFDRRVDTGDKSGVSILFVVDEFNILMRSSKISDETKALLTKALLDIEQGGAKFGMFVWIIGQKWANQDLGNDGVAVRTSLVSRIAHRFSDSDQACLFMGVKNAKVREQNARLVRGCYLFINANGQQHEVTTPPTFATDGRLVLSLLKLGAVTNQREVVESTVPREVRYTDPVNEDDEESVAELRAMSYKEYLKSRHWQKTRRGVLDRAKLKCSVCGVSNTQLDVHHNTYERIGCELDSDLFVMCHDCHELFTLNRRLASQRGNIISTHFPSGNGEEMIGNGSTSPLTQAGNDHLQVEGNATEMLIEHKKEEDLPGNENVNTQGVSREVREQIRRMRSVRPKKYSHAEISNLVGLGGRRYHIYKQVCIEEGIQ